MVVDRYIAVSHHMAKMLRQVCVLGDRKIRVVHNGIPLEPFERGIRGDLRERLAGRDDRPIVLTLARLARQKGIGYLIEAAARVPEAFFAVAGDGEERAALEAKADAWGVKERFLFLGHRRDVPELLASCDVFVLPSLYEGLPVSVLEAMASGKPVIATRIGGTDEAVKDGATGLLVPPADPTALAEAIRRLLTDRCLAERLGAEAQNWVRREFSDDLMAARVQQIYREALGGSA
jgi:glycosyltransferase involved in cell wall biosynthesis